jgi:hypothetical protein
MCEMHLPARSELENVIKELCAHAATASGSDLKSTLAELHSAIGEFVVFTTDGAGPSMMFCWREETKQED